MVTMLRKAWLVLLATWAILSIGVLGQFLYDTRTAAENTDAHWVRAELEVRLTWGLIILNFPLSLGVAAIGPKVPTGPIAEWCALTVVGFVQWALLVPALGRALRPLAARLRPRRAP